MIIDEQRLWTNFRKPGTVQANGVKNRNRTKTRGGTINGCSMNNTICFGPRRASGRYSPSRSVP